MTERPQRWTDGVALGGLAVLAFSGTLPATRVAVPAFGPTILTWSRIEIAAVLSVVTLALLRSPSRPRRRHLPGLLVTGTCLAVGFPLFIALAVEHVPAAHGAVVVGLAPATTALFAVLRAGERPPPRFWVGCIGGVGAVALFALHEGGGRIALADAWLFLAVTSVGIGYVEGGRLGRELGATETFCWTMIVMAPLVALPLALEVWLRPWPAISWQAWSGFWYAGVVAMFLGAVTWYRGLAAGGIARIGQMNLIQPVLALVWSALLLGEEIGWPLVATAAAVFLSMAVCLRSRVATARPAAPGEGGPT